MEFLRASLFALGIFVTLTIISLLVAFMMMIIYKVVHKTEKKAVQPTQAQPTGAGKAG
jgi:large-conductance mechanosensitive channel